MRADELVVQLQRARILPVLRSATATAAADDVGRLVEAGLGVVELTTSTPEWADALAQVRRSYPDLVVGVGTVTSVELACRASGEGADFLVTPFAVPGARESAGEVTVVEGGLTPGEVAAAAAADGVAKLFPAHVGGPRYLSGLLDVLPGTQVVPTGGIRLDDVPAWLAAGALAVGVGRALLDVDDLPSALAVVLR